MLDTILVGDKLDTPNPLLNIPRDIAFMPANDDSGKFQLWVVNRGTPCRIEGGTYMPNDKAGCEVLYKERETPPENSRFWPSFTIIDAPGIAASNDADVKVGFVE